MKNCPHCGEEIQDSAKVCKHCNRDIKKKTSLASGIVAVIIFFVAFSFIGNILKSETVTPAATPSTSKPSVVTTPPVKQSKVEILSQSEKDESGKYKSIVGEVKNTGAVPVTYIRLTATFYDSGNNVVDTDFTYAENDELQPDTSSPFKLTFEEITYDHYKLDVTWRD